MNAYYCRSSLSLFIHSTKVYFASSLSLYFLFLQLPSLNACLLFLISSDLDKEATSEQLRNANCTNEVELQKNTRKIRNGSGRNNSKGGRVERSKGFLPSSFDRVLLDAPCSALGLRPRLFAGEVRHLS